MDVFLYNYLNNFSVIGCVYTSGDCNFSIIYSEGTKKGGLVLIIDARYRAWRVARSCIRLSVMLLGSRATSVFVIRPDGFWDKRVDSCTKSYKDSEVRIFSLKEQLFY